MAAIFDSSRRLPGGLPNVLARSDWIRSRYDLLPKKLREELSPLLDAILDSFLTQHELNRRLWDNAGTNQHNRLADRYIGGAHPGSAITNEPAGGISSTTVQDAINELDLEKQDFAQVMSKVSLGF